MELLSPKYIPDYRKRQRMTLAKHLDRLKRKVNGGGVDLLRVYESAVYSSQVEGSKVTVREFTSTLEAAGDRQKPRDIQEVKDLVDAYAFAQGHELNTKNLLEAHRIASALVVLSDNDRGAWRTKGVKVGNAFTTVYMAPHQSQVPALMDQLMSELQEHLARNLDLTEAFYYASLLHLQFVKVHPFIDGNGRSARLLEKWFLAKHLGPIAWSIRSEKYIINHRDEYYDALGRLGSQWGTLDYDQCIPFLLLLPRSLRNK